MLYALRCTSVNDIAVFIVALFNHAVICIIRQCSASRLPPARPQTIWGQAEI